MNEASIRYINGFDMEKVPNAIVTSQYLPLSATTWLCFLRKVYVKTSEKVLSRYVFETDGDYAYDASKLDYDEM